MSWSVIWMRSEMKRQEKRSYYHVCTDGNQLPWMFRDDEDFRNGINRLAICSFALELSVICFVLMDNHVHFIFYGTLVQCKEFASRYKSAISKWIAEKYGINGYLANLSTEIISIDSEEALMETIAYIDRNSIMAGYKCLPCDYPWGSAKYMFREKCSVVSSRNMFGEEDSVAPSLKGNVNVKNAVQEAVAGEIGSKWMKPSVGKIVKEIAGLQVVERRSLIRSRKRIPIDWEIDQHGMILPYCFLSIDTLNKLFVSPLRYLYFLSKKLEGKIDMQQGIRSFISDRDMRVETARLSREMFGIEDVKSLDFESKIILARKLRYQYASTPKQISRMLSLDVGTLSEFI